MSKTLNIVIILLVLGIAGWLKLPYETKLAEELHKNKLIPPRLSLEQRTKLKQKAFIATYGSLRPTIAAYMSIEVASYHSEQDWDKVEESFEEIFLLDPYNLYYWDTGSWHMSTNAASDKREDLSLTEVAREKAYNDYINKGRNMLDRSIKANPGDYRFLLLKAQSQANRYRNPDYKAAVKTYREVLARNDLSPSIRRTVEIKAQFSLLSIPEWHQEMYENALRLYNLNSNYRVPTVLNAIFTGQNHPLNKISDKITLVDLYQSNLNAYRILKIKWLRRELGQKPYGVKQAVRELENKLSIPTKDRVFK